MITSLDLKDFKCFESFNTPISLRRINLLTGSNGRGKSSLFQSILLLAQSFKSGKGIECLRLNGRNVKLGSFFDVLRRGSDTNSFTIAFTSDDDDEYGACFIFRECKNPRLANLESLRIKYVNDIEKELVSTVGGDQVDFKEESVIIEDHGIVATSTSAIKVINQLRNVYYISADRQGPINYVNREDDYVDSVGVHGEYAIHTLKNKEGVILQKTVNYISDIMGGASISINDVDTEYIKILIDSNNNNNGFKPVNVGFGYSYILPIVVLPIVVDAGSKIFIENPEAHLHPGAQSRMMNFLISIAKERNLQLFIETHSDHIVNALRIATKNKSYGINHNDSVIIHVDRDDNKKTSYSLIKMDPEGNLSDYPRDFMEEWTKQMLDLV